METNWLLLSVYETHLMASWLGVGGVYRTSAGKQPSPEPDHTGTQILTFHLTKRNRDLWLRSHLVHNDLSELLDLTNV